MDPARFEQLLYEEEGTSLDFKRDQYAFARASDEEKSELLKDILGFVNAWKRSEAYILIGVEEVRGGRSKVVGVAEHLADHSLQQFVNNRTNRPVQFGYEAFSFDGKQIGVVRIEQQPRPVFLKQNYGKLEKDKVYVRRGSSTDPSQPAGPDEIARMGLLAVAEKAELSVLFAELDREQAIGDVVEVKAEFCEMPKQIPSVSQPKQQTAWAVMRVEERLNESFLREMAEFIFFSRLFRPVRLVIQNTGTVAADDVRVELRASKDQQVSIKAEGQLPKRPYRNHFQSITAGLGRPQSTRQRSGNVSVLEDQESLQIQIDCGSMQPGRKVWSETFYVARGDAGEINLKGLIFAVNLTPPTALALTVAVQLTLTQTTVDELNDQLDAGEAAD